MIGVGFASDFALGLVFVLMLFKVLPMIFGLIILFSPSASRDVTSKWLARDSNCLAYLKKSAYF